MAALSFSATAVIREVSGDPPYTVAVIPGAGCTALVELSLSGKDGTLWYPWEAGTAGAVTASTIRSILSPIRAVRFTRTVGAAACTGEVIG